MPPSSPSQPSAPPVLWGTSQLERPLSPSRPSKYDSLAGGKKNVGKVVHPLLVDDATEECRTRNQHTITEYQSKNTTVQAVPFTVHYIGLTKGELGVLSKRQAIETRPATAPSNSSRTNHGRPLSSTGLRNTYRKPGPVHEKTYCTIDYQTKGYQGLDPPRAPTPGDMKLVVDDPLALQYAQQDIPVGRPLHAAPPSGRASRWRDGSNVLAGPYATYDMTTRWQPKVLTAGGFPGLRLSRRNTSDAFVVKPCLPPKLQVPTRASTSPPVSRTPSPTPQTKTGSTNTRSRSASPTHSGAAPRSATPTQGHVHAMTQPHAQQHAQCSISGVRPDSHPMVMYSHPSLKSSSNHLAAHMQGSFKVVTTAAAVPAVPVDAVVQSSPVHDPSFATSHNYMPDDDPASTPTSPDTGVVPDPAAPNPHVIAADSGDGVQEVCFPLVPTPTQSSPQVDLPVDVIEQQEETIDGQACQVDTALQHQQVQGQELEGVQGEGLEQEQAQAQAQGQESAQEGQQEEEQEQEGRAPHAEPAITGEASADASNSGMDRSEALEGHDASEVNGTGGTSGES